MGSKLETGCKAIVTRGRKSNLGKFVTVGNFIGTLPGFLHDDIWEVDKEMDTNNEPNFMNSGANMQRIDDHPEKETILESVNLEA